MQGGVTRLICTVHQVRQNEPGAAIHIRVQTLPRDINKTAQYQLHGLTLHSCLLPLTCSILLSEPFSLGTCSRRMEKHGLGCKLHKVDS